MTEFFAFLNEILNCENIEYFSALPLSECKIINQSIFDRCTPGAKSCVIFLVPYFNGDREDRNISLYAVPRDYHLYVKELGERLSARLSERFPDNSFKFMSDHSPIAETHAGAVAGLGVIGENYRLINEKYGSYVFIAEIFTDMEMDACGCEPKRCVGCGLCKKACPDPEFCLSAQTQEKGELSEKSKALMLKYNTGWGCDICQTVCPMNRGVAHTPIEFFKNELIYRLTPEILSEMSEEELSRRAFGWRKRKTVERNINLLFGK